MRQVIRMSRIVGIVILVFTAQLSAQKFERISIRQGLSHGSVYAIAQDAGGFMWFGTEDGLNRYDGYEIKVFRHDPSDPESLPYSNFGKIYIEQSGIMWFGSWGGGLLRYDPADHRFTTFRHRPDDPTGLSQDHIECLMRDHTGKLWVGTAEGGVNVLDPASYGFKHYRHDPSDPAGISSNEIKALCEDRDGAVWIGTDNGLNRLDPKTGAVRRFHHLPETPGGISHNRIRSILVDRGGALWIGTRGGGLNRFNRETETFTVYKHQPDNPTSISDNAVTQVFEDSYGILWIGAYNGGLNRFDRWTGKFIHYKYDPGDPDSLSHNRVEVIFEDRARVLWLGTRGGGVNKLDLKPTKFNNHTYNPLKPGGLPHPNVTAIADGHAKNTGAIWIGTDGGGLCRFNSGAGTFAHFPGEPGSPDSLNDNRVWALLSIPHGPLWVGTHSGGLNKITRDDKQFHFTHYKHHPNRPNSIAGNRIQVLFRDKTGDTWIGTDRGLDRLITAQNGAVSFQHFRRKPSAPSSNIKSVETIFQDQTGILWVGAQNGLNRLDPHSESFTAYSHHPTDPTTLSNNYVHVISEISGDTSSLWIGTDIGLNRWDRKTGKFKRYALTEGLPSAFISGILPDNSGRLWISTGKGISRFEPASETFKNYDISDGLPGGGFNRGAFLKSRNGEMLFGAIAGLVTFYPQKVKDNPYIPPVAITALKVFGRELSPKRLTAETGGIVLPHDRNFVSFEFTALDYNNPAKNRYSYKLSGIDREWQPAESRHSAEYLNLPPGEYEFRVRGSNNDGVWNTKGAALSFTINASFLQTWWFRTLMALLLISAVFFVFRLRLSNIRQRNKVLQDHNLRLEEQIQKREEAEAERTTLQEQLRHAQKMETIGTLAGGIAHDFNNILGPILGYSQMAMQEVPPGTDISQWLKHVQKAANRAKELVQQILLFGRRDKQEFKPVKPEIVFKEALRFIRASFPATVEIRQEISDDCDPVLADPTQLHQVMLNLCTNAKHAMLKKGGVLTVRLSMENLGAKQAGAHPALNPGWYAKITVSDTGCGMDNTTLARLFEPFFTTKPPGEGSGLGLAVVHGIVTEHGGAILVESEPGKGSVFDIYLPTVDHEIVEEPVKVDVLPKGNERILLVDDEESMVIMGRIMLRQLGYKVTTFTQSDEALEVFKKNPDQFDMLVTDQTMPQLTGTQLSKAVKEIRPDLPVIIISGFVENIDKKEVKECGIAGYLAKPFDAHSIGCLIRNLLDMQKQKERRGDRR